MHGFTLSGKKKHIKAFLAKMQEAFKTFGTRDFVILLKDKGVREILEVEHSIKIGV